MARRPAAEKVDSCLSPKFRLFFSVDLVGSTALKQKASLKLNQDGDYTATDPEAKGKKKPFSPDWLVHISSFYKNFDRCLGDKFLESVSEMKHKTVAQKSYISKIMPNLAPFNFWKSIGDELLYYVEISSEIQVVAYVNIWIDALNDFMTPGRSKNMRVKSTIFSGGFPFLNSEIVFDKDRHASKYADDPIIDNYDQIGRWRKGETDGRTIDFIGPSIDTGFRLGQYASPRKTIISIDVAYLIAKANISMDSAKTKGARYLESRQIYFEGYQQLKGVFSGREYPIFWINSGHDDELLKIENRIMNNREVEKDLLKTFCEQYYVSIGEFTFKPFIWEAANSNADVPSFYMDKLLQWSGMIKKMRATIDAEGKKENESKNSLVEVTQKDVGSAAKQALSVALAGGRKDGAVKNKT